jgi:hypothetical protein
LEPTSEYEVPNPPPTADAVQAERLVNR